MTIWKTRATNLFLAAAISSLAAACAAGPQPVPVSPPVSPPPPAAPPVSPPPPVVNNTPISYTSSGHGPMDTWRADFSSRMQAKNHSRDVIESCLSGIKPHSMYIKNTARTAGSDIGDQAEFSKPIWEYLRTAVSDTRKSNGAARMAEESALFDRLEARYGVDREVLVAIWGMETNYGTFIGNDDACNTLANMAVEGRRRKLGESELEAILRQVQAGTLASTDLKSGWAGAMGQTQFMPGTLESNAQDFDGDGTVDIWTSRADALATAAQYLSRSGYRTGQPWAIEVIVPAGFDYALADDQDRQMTTWTSKGLTPIRGGAFDTGGANYAELWVPTGAQGPKFLLFKNFKVFKTYNNADSYATAVGMLSQGVKGQSAPVAAWPKHLQPLSKADVKSLQAGLNARGFDAGVVDGLAGRRTKAALRGFQTSRGIVADGYPTQEMLTLVRSTSAPG